MSTTITDATLQKWVIEAFNNFNRPYYRKIKMGDPFAALSEKPSGVWYGTQYATFLDAVGDREIPVRGTTTEKATTLSRQLREAGYFLAPRGPKDFWSNVNAPTGHGIKYLSLIVIKEGVLPSDAYKALGTKLTILDCEQTVEAAITIAALRALGDERFNEVAKKESKGRFFAIGEGGREETIYCRLVNVFTNRIALPPPLSFNLIPRELKPGHTYYLANHENYRIKHLFGSANGMNLIYLGENKFTGFGLNPEGVTLEEVALSLLEEYNAAPLRPDLIREEALKDHSAITYTFEAFGRVLKCTLEQARDFARGISPPIISQEEWATILPCLEEQQKMRKEKERELADHKIGQEDFFKTTKFFSSLTICSRLSLDKIESFISPVYNSTC